MNDFVSLQKDVALISILGPIEVLRRAGIQKAQFANFTPYVGAARDLPLRHDPADPAVTGPPARSGSAVGRQR